MAKPAKQTTPPPGSDPDRRKQLLASVADFSKNGSSIFFAILLACSYSVLAIANTNDEDLLTNSTTTPLPIIQTSVPIVWFYYAAPALLLAAFIYFHLYLNGLWSGLGELRHRHMAGRHIDEDVYPWLISTAMLRATQSDSHLNFAGHVLRRLESLICKSLAWFLVPLLLLIFLVRFLPRHDLWGTALHVFLVSASVAAATGFMLGAIAMLRNGPKATDDREGKFPARYLTSTSVFLATGGILAFLAFGAMRGSPSANCEQTGTCGPIYAGAHFLESAGIAFNANIVERDVSGKPPGWTSAKNEDAAAVETVRKAVLRGRDMHSIQGNGAFLIGADLRNAILGWADLDDAKLQFARLTSANVTSASLSEAHLRGADLSQATLYDAYLTQADLHGATLNEVNARNAHLNSADLSESTGVRGDFRNADLRFAKLEGASLLDTDFTDANMPSISAAKASFKRSLFNGARMRQANLSEADLAFAQLEGAFLSYADFTGASLTNANFKGADLQQAIMAARDAANADFTAAKLGAADLTGVDMRNATFENADLSAAFLDGANLTGAKFAGAVLANTGFNDAVLVGADLRGAKGLTQVQLDKACGNAETKLPQGLAIATCGMNAINVETGK